MMKATTSAGLVIASTASALMLMRCGEKPKTQPNILLILADDLGYSDIGCYGSEIETPNLDILAANGVQFTNFYNTARSCPSRASLLTGLHPHQAGLGTMVDNTTDTPGYLGELNNQCVTIAEVLHGSGYSTYMTGKWHVAHSQDGSNKHNWPVQRGFDRYYGIISGATSFFDPEMLVYDNDTLLSSPPGYYMTDAISDSTVSFIGRHYQNNPEKPFFMYVAYNAPHWPIQAKPEDIEKYRGRFNAGWDKLRVDKLKRMTDMGLVKPEWDIKDVYQGQSWDDVTLKEWELARMEVYAAMVDCMDQGIGRIIKKLEDEGEMDNTIIIFLSDNGACAETWSPQNPWASNFGPAFTRDSLAVDYSNDGSKLPGSADTYHSYGRGWAHYSNTPLRGFKSGSFEGGIASPFIVYWKGKAIKNDDLREQVSGIIDIMPTLVEASGAEYPAIYNGNAILEMEGKSLVGAIRKNEEVERDAYYVEHIGNRGMIEDNRWKLTKPGRQPWQLYDLHEDRTETKDLAREMPEMTKELSDKWERWAWRAKVLPKPN
jgi:arylsulfatase A-like enzyme